MKIGIYDLDSIIANLALMKISAWHKSKGDQVYRYLELEKYDKVYISKVFKFSKMPKYFIDNYEVGGSGFDLEKKLPVEIDQMKPDYDLYPRNTFDIGFISRGCPRSCAFCIVPAKEGKLKQIDEPMNIYSGRHKKIMFLDNNFTALRDRIDLLKTIIKMQNKTRVKISFTQGLDIRLINDEFMYYFKEIKRYEKIRVAFDNLTYKDKFMKGMAIMKKYTKMRNVMVYVLVGFDTPRSDDLERLELVRETGAIPYLMKFDKTNDYQKRIARWVNRPAMFAKVPWLNFEKYDKLTRGHVEVNQLKLF